MGAPTDTPAEHPSEKPAVGDTNGYEHGVFRFELPNGEGASEAPKVDEEVRSKPSSSSRSKLA
jgi:hypothetical protein